MKIIHPKMTPKKRKKNHYEKKQIIKIIQSMKIVKKGRNSKKNTKNK